MASGEPALEEFGITSSPNALWIGGEAKPGGGETIEVRSPIDGRVLATIKSATPADVNRAVDAAADAFVKWREVPAPKRGEFVRRIGERLRERKADLARIVQLEAGKITQEALGEVQEMI